MRQESNQDNNNNEEVEEKNNESEDEIPKEIREELDLPIKLEGNEVNF